MLPRLGAAGATCCRPSKHGVACLVVDGLPRPTALGCSASPRYHEYGDGGSVMDPEHRESRQQGPQFELGQPSSGQECSATYEQRTSSNTDRHEQARKSRLGLREL